MLYTMDGCKFVRFLFCPVCPAGQVYPIRSGMALGARVKKIGFFIRIRRQSTRPRITRMSRME